MKINSLLLLFFCVVLFATNGHCGDADLTDLTSDAADLWGAVKLLVMGILTFGTLLFVIRRMMRADDADWSD